MTHTQTFAALLIAASLLMLVQPGHVRGARPMIVDDARIIDAGSCQLEAWRRFNRDSQENWALPGCNPAGNIEFLAWLGGPGPDLDFERAIAEALTR